MIFSKAAISLLCVLLIISIFMASLLNIIATDHNFYIENKDEGLNYTKYLSEKYMKITDSSKNLIWFLQISDIHISIFRDPGRISQFQQFCDNTVKNIKPNIVLATGDLTDAKAKDNLGSSQVKKEWIYYYNIVQESGVTSKTIWLDIRGNHDNFNIKNINAQENYFRNYSVQGKTYPRSYVHILNENGVKVAFLGVDACPDPGIRRPFNFIGILDNQEQQHLQKLKLEAESKADHVVWFGHYPTSCILSLERDSQRLNLRQLISNAKGSQVYVCGHLHSMGGLVPQMYTIQRKGFLELELGDWKDNRMYRLAAIDHGIFSFVDQKHNTWPVVLVTNPKHALYAMPGREPLTLIRYSTHVRILAFSDVNIDSVQISYDKINWSQCKLAETPLYVCQWQPDLFKSGLHNLYVMGTDEIGRKTIVDHPFSLDGSNLQFKVVPRILLMLDAGGVFQTLFGTLLMVNILPLVILRFQKRPPKCRRGIANKILRRIWLLTKIDRVFYPLVLYVLYIPFGPWVVGELIDGYIGVVFAWGIVIRGSYIPEPFTYMYGSVQLMFVHMPLVFVLAYCLEMRLFGQHLRGVKRLLKNLPFIFLLSIQLLLAYFYWLEYGTLAFIFGPLRTWSVFLNILLWYKTLTLPPDYCRSLLKLEDLPS
ncbi:transmembrane protein 62 isoform X1 [Papilio machaon]|uniref:transmembrane protein 62 isoform X1 n=2 Tax=Papilio machaon TaxID=76193 RepID=UPI001E666197|nr:transmembrane protein 62 isoform X1 [Papilio machaon]XP_045534779.1 transmembrane protein 62 isoform X1 [Papilio machaon]